MKHSLYIIAIATVFCTSASAQTFVEDAIKMAALVPAANNDGGCKLTTKPCAITNKAPERAITVKIEETIIINDEMHKRVMVMERIAPGEKRFIGCAGTTRDDQKVKSAGYKILLAYYDEVTAESARAAMAEPDSDSTSQKTETEDN